MSERRFDLEALRADGWFDRVIAGVPALERLCNALGEALVAMALTAGFRVVSASVDRTTGDVASLTWTRDDEGGAEVEGHGTPQMLRTEVLSTLLGETDPPVEVLEDKPDTATLRRFIGQRYLMLAPLFGLTLRTLLVGEFDEPRVVAAHDGVEEIVPLKQLRRFLRSRVVDALQANRGRGVSIDLQQAAHARDAFSAGRYDEVVGRLAAWVAPLMMYHRTPEAAAMDVTTRADISRALSVLGRSFHHLGRTDESEETLRLAVQYGHDSPAAPELYETLAQTMMKEKRFAEAIGPWRRAIAQGTLRTEILLGLGECFVETERAVAALGCLHQARALGATDEEVAPLEAAVQRKLGSALEDYRARLRPSEA